MSGWRVVLVGGETLAIVTDTDSTRYDRRAWYTAEHDRMTTGSYVGHLDAMLDLARYHKWAVREVVPPGELTTAEAIAAERQRVADVLAEVARGLDGRAASCDGIAGDCDLRMRKIAETLPIDTSAVETEWETRVRVMGKSAAYEHAAELVRAEFATIGGDRG